MDKTFKSMFPDDVESITMTRQDYDRHIENLLYENVELKQRIDKAIKYMEKLKKENDKMINFEIQHDEYQHEGAEYQNELIDELLDILKGSDKE